MFKGIKYKKPAAWQTAEMGFKWSWLYCLASYLSVLDLNCLGPWEPADLLLLWSSTSDKNQKRILPSVAVTSSCLKILTLAPSNSFLTASKLTASFANCVSNCTTASMDTSCQAQPAPPVHQDLLLLLIPTETLVPPVPACLTPESAPSVTVCRHMETV